MDNKLQVFTYDSNRIRITEVDGELWFVARDICDVLGLADVSMSVKPLDDDEKLIQKLFVSGQNRDVTTISESGLYALVLRSNKPEAKRFSKWVRSEVLPVIRKHGGYILPEKAEEFIANPDLIIKLAEAVKEKRAKIQALEAKVEENRPKVIFAEAVSASKNSILIRELAKLIAQNGQKIGEKRLYQWLRDHDFLCKYGESRNLPQQRFIEQGLFEIKKYIVAYGDGTQKVKPTTKVTGKGQQYFIDGFLSGRFRL